MGGGDGGAKPAPGGKSTAETVIGYGRWLGDNLEKMTEQLDAVTNLIATVTEIVNTVKAFVEKVRVWNRTGDSIGHLFRKTFYSI